MLGVPTALVGKRVGNRVGAAVGDRVGDLVGAFSTEMVPTMELWMLHRYGKLPAALNVAVNVDPLPIKVPEPVNPPSVELTVCWLLSVTVHLTESPTAIVVVPWFPTVRNQFRLVVAAEHSTAHCTASTHNTCRIMFKDSAGSAALTGGAPLGSCVGKLGSVEHVLAYQYTYYIYVRVVIHLELQT